MWRAAPVPILVWIIRAIPMKSLAAMRMSVSEPIPSVDGIGTIYRMTSLYPRSTV